MSLELMLPLPPDLLGHESKASQTGPRAESLLMIGPKRSLKTSLLFQTAINLAEKGDEVLFFCPQSVEELPLPVHGSKKFSSSSSAQRVVFHYLKAPEDLLKALEELHLNPKSSYPSGILVDDIDLLLRKRRSSFEKTGLSTKVLLAQMFALLLDSAAFVSKKTGKPCYLYVASGVGGVTDEAVVIDSLGQRFFENIVHIKSIACLGNERQTFGLTFDESRGASATLHLYSEDGQIFVDRLCRTSTMSAIKEEPADGNPASTSSSASASASRPHPCQHYHLNSVHK